MRLRELGILTCMGLACASAQVQAQDTGFVALHTLKRVGSKTCMADHFHSGSSSGHASRKEAEAAAIRSWEGFTGWEYGNHWGRFSLAESKKVSCSGGGSWGCEVEARPCRPATLKGAVAKAPVAKATARKKQSALAD